MSVGLRKDLLPEEFLSAVQADKTVIDNILSNKDSGAAFFRFAELEASNRFKIGWKEITRAGLWLEIIRQHKLYEFADYKSWTQFLEDWIDNGARGRTRIRDMLMVFRLWQGETINRQLPELLQFEEGAASIEPAFIGGARIINDAGDNGYNPRTGEIKELKPEWANKLQGNTVAEKINFLIESIPHEATKTHTREMLKSEIPKAKCEFFPCFKGGVCSGFVAHFYDMDGQLTQEITVECPDFWGAAREIGLDGKMMAMFRFPMEWRTG